MTPAENCRKEIKKSEKSVSSKDADRAAREIGKRNSSPNALAYVWAAVAILTLTSAAGKQILNALESEEAESAKKSDMAK